MIIDRDWLTEQGACSEGKEFFLKEGITDPVLGIKNLLNKDRLSWANWLLVRVLPQQQRVQYACYAAKQVLKYFEKARPKDKRPRKAIEAALKLVKYPTAANRSAARSAASAARSAASAAMRRKIIKYGLSLFVKSNKAICSTSK